MRSIACFAFQPVMLDGMSWEDFLNAAAEADLTGIEIGVGGFVSTRGTEAEHLLSDASARNQLVRSVRERDLTIVALNCIGNPLHPNPEVAQLCVEALDNAIDLAPQLDVTTIVAASGCPGDGGATPNWITWPVFWDDLLTQQWNTTIGLWSKIERKAAQAGVTVCLELHPGMIVYNTSTFRRLMEATGSALRVNLDPSHLWYQGMDPLAVVNALDTNIGFVHAKDTVINPERMQIDGVLDPSPIASPSRVWAYRGVGIGHGLDWWASFIRALADVGYTGPISIEHEDPLLHGRQAIDENARALHHSLNLAGTP